MEGERLAPLVASTNLAYSPPQVEVYDDVDELIDDSFKGEEVDSNAAQTVLNESGKPMPLPPKAH